MSNHKENNPTLLDLSSTSDLKTEKLKTLVQRFDDIGSQSQILQGRILIELYARSNAERLDFDAFAEKEGIQNSTLCALTHQHRNRLINLAKFFTDDRPMTGISITVGYEISAPKNHNVAKQVYALAVNQNYSVKEIKTFIEKQKQEVRNNSDSTNTKLPPVKVTFSKKVTMNDEAQKVMNFVRSLKPDNFNLQEALVIFKTCYTKVQEDIKGNVIEGTVTV